MLDENDLIDSLTAALASGAVGADELVDMVEDMVDPEEEKREAENRKMRVNALVCAYHPLRRSKSSSAR